MQDAERVAGPSRGRALAPRALAGVVADDHLACAFGSEEEHRQVVGRAAGEAFARGQRLLYTADRSDPEAICGCLEEAGLDAEALLSSGQLEIEPCADVYLGDDGFDRPRQLARLEAEGARAREDGFGGLAVMAEMSWVLGRDEEMGEIVAYEHQADRVLTAAGIIAICEYDRRLFPDDLLAQLLRAHGIRVATDRRGSVATHGTLTVREGEADLALAGEIDLREAGYLDARLAEHRPAQSYVVVDAGELSFIDLSGCRALMEMARRLSPDRRLLVVDPPPSMVRVMGLCEWLGDPQVTFVHRHDAGPERR